MKRNVKIKELQNPTSSKKWRKWRMMNKVILLDTKFKKKKYKKLSEEMTK